MPSLDSNLSATSITTAQFIHLLSLYPAVLRRVYGRKVKDSAKLAEALEDDAWRYGELGDVLAERCRRRYPDGGGDGDGGRGWLEKAELERLVRWKITHGQNRPFLPSQIRKNDPSSVKAATTAAFAALALPSPSSSLPPPPPQDRTPTPTFSDLAPALTQLLTLTGVGPATASLLLSIHDPITTPFFQDELFHWLCRPHDTSKASSGGSAMVKLKYNLKEYRELFEAVGALQRRLASSEGQCPLEVTVTTVEVEKVGFVVGHLDLVEGGREQRGAGENEEDGGMEEEGLTGGDGSKKGPNGKREEEEEEEEEEAGGGEKAPASVPAAKAKRKTKRKTKRKRDDASAAAVEGEKKKEKHGPTTRKSQRLQ